MRSRSCQVVVLLLEIVGLGRRSIVMVVIVVVAVMVTVTVAIMIAVAAMLHGYVVALHEAFAILVAHLAGNGRMTEHAGVVWIPPTAIFHVVACCLDAVMEALPFCVAEL